MRPYVIRQGDYLTKLAHSRGFDADTIWNHGKNAAIRDLRPNRDLLHPGDVLWIPDAPDHRQLPVKAGSSNSYVAIIPKMPVELRLQIGGESLQKEPYRILGLGPDPIEGVTDDDGWLRAEVDVHVREIEVELVERSRTLRARVGGLDPVDTLAGLKKRLTHLGYYQPSSVGVENDDAADGDALVSALKSFQAARGLATSGKLDEASKNALLVSHGS